MSLFIFILFSLSYYKFFYYLTMYLYHKFKTKNHTFELDYYGRLYDWVHSYWDLVKWER